MSGGEVVYGLLDTSAAINDEKLARRCRELTLNWCRYDYSGLIIEHTSIDEIVREAFERGYAYCFVLAYGQVIHERWTPCEKNSGGFLQALIQSCRATDSMLACEPLSLDDGRHGVDDRCLLVNIEKHTNCGRPDFGYAGTGFVDASWRFGLPVAELAESVRRRIVDLQPRGSNGLLLRKILMSRKVDFDTNEIRDFLDAPQLELLQTVQIQTQNARRGVFLLNIESNADVESPHADFAGPVSSLYCVASGFKPNRILQTHGMSTDSRVVYFDYSGSALRIKRVMVEEWDGRDFPKFMRHIFSRFPEPETYYQLWAGATSATVDWSIVNSLWQSQLEQMGGERAFEQHWKQYKQLRHEYILCDVLDDPHPLLEQIRPGPGAVMWSSNAAFTMCANWRYDIDERRNRYRRWIECVAAMNSDMLLYGSDYINSNVNNIAAGEYWRRFQSEDQGALKPCNLYEKQVRM